MQIRKWMVTAVAPLALFAAACGDGDGDASPTQPAITATAAASAVPDAGFTPVAFDDADKAYAARLCTAFDNYDTSLQKFLASDPAVRTDVTKLLNGLNPILDTLLNDIQRSDPPQALFIYAASVESSVQAIRGAVREGRIADIQDFGPGVGVAAPPKEQQDRVRSAAAAAPECAGNELFFTVPAAG